MKGIYHIRDAQFMCKNNKKKDAHKGEGGLSCHITGTMVKENENQLNVCKACNYYVILL